MVRLPVAAAVAVLLTVGTEAAGAQTAAVPGAAGPTQPAQTPPATDLGTTSGSLSDKLGRSGGVIRPQGDVDPAIHKAAPQSGRMPVIKPGQVEPGTAK